MHRLRLEVEAMLAEAKGQESSQRLKTTKEYWRGRKELCNLMLIKMDKYIDDEAAG